MLAGAMPTARATPRIVSPSSPPSSASNRPAAARISPRSRSPSPQRFLVRPFPASTFSGTHPFIRPRPPGLCSGVPDTGTPEASVVVHELPGECFAGAHGVGVALDRRHLRILEEKIGDTRV